MAAWTPPYLGGFIRAVSGDFSDKFPVFPAIGAYAVVPTAVILCRYGYNECDNKNDNDGDYYLFFQFHFFLSLLEQEPIVLYSSIGS